MLRPMQQVGLDALRSEGASLPVLVSSLARLRACAVTKALCSAPTERWVSEILGIKLSRKMGDGSRLFFFLGDVRSCLRHIPSCCFPETVPEIVECGKVA